MARFFEFPAGGFNSVAYDISASSSVVGRGRFSGANYRAYIYSPTAQSFYWLPCPFPSQYGTFCEAYGVNNNGVVVVTSDPRYLYPESPEAASKALIWNDNDSVTEIIPGGISVANDINNSNTVVGMVDYEPFIWNSATGLQRLGGYSNRGSVGRLIFANAINDGNHAIGGHTENEEGLAQRAFYWDGVAARDIGTLGITSVPPGDSRPVVGANDINNADQIVGNAAVSYDENDLMITHAFIWDDENGMRDLNDLIPADSGIILTQATGINNNGEIAAVGYVVGHNQHIQRDYLLK